MANTSGLAGDTIAQVTTYLMNRLVPYVDKSEILDVILQQLMAGEITLAQVQRTEDGAFHVLPAMVVPQVSTNGKKEKKASKNTEVVAVPSE
jgi:hypothetical protein